MFRTLFRRPRAVKIPAHNGAVEMQRVEIRRRPSKASMAVRQFAVNAILFYCAFHTVKFWIYGPDPEVQKRYDELHKQRAAQKAADQRRNAATKATGDKPDEKTETTDDRIVIPIYGWIKQMDPKPLKLGDPDVKALVALLNDERAVAKLYDEILQNVIKQIKSSKTHARYLVQLDWQGRYQKNLHFGRMMRHPPYAMRCIIFEPGKIALGWKELSAQDGARIQRLQQPLVLSEAFFKGLWAFTTTATAIAQAKLLDTMYGERKWLYRLVYQTQKEQTEFIGIVNPKTREETVISKLPSAAMSDAQVQKLFPFLKGSFGQGVSYDAFRTTAQSMIHQSLLQHSVHIFKHHVLSGQQKAQALSTPGTVPIIGFFDLVSNKGIYRVEVLALHVLREHSFISPIMITNAYFLYESPKPKPLPDASSSQNQQAPIAQHARPEASSKRPESTPEAPEKGTPSGKETGK